jgi:hypothetical protein
MPNQHHPDKEVMGVYINRRLAAKVRREAKRRQTTVTGLLETLLTHATKNIELTAEDLRQIAERKAHALRRSPRPKPRPQAAKGRKD